MLKLMGEQLEFVKYIAGRLDSVKIPYMLTGSVAMAVYAEPRMTRDLDMVIDCRSADAVVLVRLLEPECYVDVDAIRKAIDSHTMFNAIHRKLLIKADFIVRKSETYREVEFERRRPLEIDAIRVWVVAPEDLVLSKLAWAKESRSSQQIGDVRLLVNSVQDMDWDYLEMWAVQLGVEKTLAEARSK
jgi:hypothetical protein